MKKKDLEFLYFMQGAMERFDDLPDGAWWAVGEEMVELYNTEHNKNLDLNDGFQYYVQNAGDLK